MEATLLKPVIFEEDRREPDKLRGVVSNNPILEVDHPILFLAKFLLFPSTVAALLLVLSSSMLEIIPPRHVTIATVAFLLSCIVFGQISFYRRRSSFPFFVALSSILSRWLVVACCLGGFAYITQDSLFVADDVIFYWLTSIPAVLLISQFISWKLVSLIIRCLPKRNIVIVGANYLGSQLHKNISTDVFLQMNVVGFFDDRNPTRLPQPNKDTLIGRLDNLTDYVKANHVHVVYICLPLAGQARIKALIEELADTTVSIYFIPDFLALEVIQARVDNIAGLPAMAIRETPFFGIRALIKRSIDLALSILILLLIWPIMLIVGVGVKLTSSGPMIFKQRRYGLDGQEIQVYKFRTMTVCEDGDLVVQARQNDRRITPFGAFLRRTSLDELPQFINVLEGSMSIVGPRPHAIAHNELYRKEIKGYMVRHKVKPGITGWAQVNGLRGETSSLDLMKARVEHDLDYIKNWSLTLDLWIVLRTSLLMFGDRKAY